LLAAGPLVFIDPTELSILLGDLMPWAVKAALLMAGNGLVLGLAWRLLTGWRTRPAWIPLFAPILAWTLAIAAYFGLGLRGSYGDRLFVILKDQADLSPAVQIADRDQRTAFVYSTLTHQADQTQAGIRAELDRFGIHYKPYYLVNALEVDGGALIRLYLLQRPEVDRVLPSPRLRPLPQAAPPITGYFTTRESNTGWNIEMIGADRVWDEFGVTGEGIVVGQSDSGADGSHPVLHDSYRGVDTGGDYNWYDPWNDTREPTDLGGHGTHTLGIVVGQDGIGVAPGAQWIGCVNLARGLANPPFYLDCMQFMLAPFPHSGDPFRDGDPARAAHVLNNSWGCPTLEGCDPEALRPAVDALRAAGIFVAASAGNDGPLCNTLTNPISLYDSVFSVGAVDRFGNMANFSSRGPVDVDGSGRVKPDITAPGVDVFSALPQGTYGPLSGTSMAGPHLAGVVALLWSANPDLIGDIDRTEQILTATARPYRGSRPQGECFTGGAPNDAYGYGIVDAYAAVKLALGK
jgi:subtilisin family serine protease